MFFFTVFLLDCHSISSFRIRFQLVHPLHRPAQKKGFVDLLHLAQSAFDIVFCSHSSNVGVFLCFARHRIRSNQTATTLTPNQACSLFSRSSYVFLRLVGRRSNFKNGRQKRSHNQLACPSTCLLLCPALQRSRLLKFFLFASFGGGHHYHHHYHHHHHRQHASGHLYTAVLLFCNLFAITIFTPPPFTRLGPDGASSAAGAARFVVYQMPFTRRIGRSRLAFIYFLFS